MTACPWYIWMSSVGVSIEHRTYGNINGSNFGSPAVDDDFDALTMQNTDNPCAESIGNSIKWVPQATRPISLQCALRTAKDRQTTSITEAMLQLLCEVAILNKIRFMPIIHICRLFHFILFCQRSLRYKFVRKHQCVVPADPIFYIS